MKLDIQQIAIVEDGKLIEIVEPTLDKVHSGGFLDIVVLDDVRTLIVSNTQIPPSDIFGDDAEIVDSSASVELASWMWPLMASAAFARANTPDSKWFALERSAKYLEAQADFDVGSPWQRGLLLATVRANWSDKEDESGESFWGWVRENACRECDDQEWDRERKKFYSWMRASDVLLRNVEKKKWVAKLSYDKIINGLPLSKATRACGAIAGGVFDLVPDLQAALFDSIINNDDLNHLIAQAGREISRFEITDTENGRLELVDEETGEIVDHIDLPSYSPELGIENDVGGESESPMWTFDWGSKTFGYWLGGQWTPALTVLNYEDERVKAFVDSVIVALRVKADYGNS